MHLNRRRLISASGAGLLLSGCSLTGGQRPLSFAPSKPLVPLNLSEDQLIRITVCSRPFRPGGPRLEAENIGAKRVVHNYGHGGSGWSLSWGCAEEATRLAMGSAPSSVAVIGAGVMGLTTAYRLAERGIDVTIYANEFPSETRSARATGVWSPSSRIGLGGVVPPGFEDRWERWARQSYRAHQHFIGTVGSPVEFTTQYSLTDGEGSGWTPASRDFLHLDRRVRDMTPRWPLLSKDEHPFPVERARRGLFMTFNVASYAKALTRDFHLRGGRMVRRDFPDRDAILSLNEPVIVNCTGYGAKKLWGDQSLVPVRGQINWLAPQLNARYGIFYKRSSVISRRDGLIVQYMGDNDDWGFGDDSETPDREEMRRTIGTLAELFA